MMTARTMQMARKATTPVLASLDSSLSLVTISSLSTQLVRIR